MANIKINWPFFAISFSIEIGRVLNLSDIREPKSEIFYDKIKEMENLNIPHSIFQEVRQDDFNNLWVNNVTVIFGWSVNNKLIKQALDAIEKINIIEPIGIKKVGFKLVFYHPLPPSSNKQKEWVGKNI